ncbi:Uncharacterized protein Fot_32264 [Forsythia ovata]|uniref:Uncharacterized protein n=1 Tax=Forsythia ovata TaxID=205694 RepID=A0ABD1T7A0_9LAMI
MGTQEFVVQNVLITCNVPNSSKMIPSFCSACWFGLVNTDMSTHNHLMVTTSKYVYCFLSFAEYITENKIKQRPKKFDTKVARLNMVTKLYKFASEKPELHLSRWFLTN